MVRQTSVFGLMGKRRRQLIALTKACRIAVVPGTSRYQVAIVILHRQTSPTVFLLLPQTLLRSRDAALTAFTTNLFVTFCLGRRFEP